LCATLDTGAQLDSPRTSSEYKNIYSASKK